MGKEYQTEFPAKGSGVIDSAQPVQPMVCIFHARAGENEKTINRMEALPMDYLVLSRKEGEQIRLTIAPSVDTEKLLQHLLRDGITIHVGEFQGCQVRIGVDAPKQVMVIREEIMIDYENCLDRRKVRSN